MTAIGPPHLGQRQSGSDSWGVVSGYRGVAVVAIQPNDPKAMRTDELDSSDIEF